MKTGHSFHKDTFGLISSTLVGGSQYTMRLLRGTKIAAPHVAKGDVFAYKAQFNHDKVLGEDADDFHIHIIPIGAVKGGEEISINYAWGWYKVGDTFPNTLPNTGSVSIKLEAGDQYKELIKTIVSDLKPPTNESYSSKLYVECTRLNDGTDTYAGEFALTDDDAHYTTNHLGSYNALND